MEKLILLGRRCEAVPDEGDGLSLGTQTRNTKTRLKADTPAAAFLLISVDIGLELCFLV